MSHADDFERGYHGHGHGIVATNLKAAQDWYRAFEAKHGACKEPIPPDILAPF